MKLRRINCVRVAGEMVIKSVESLQEFFFVTSVATKLTQKGNGNHMIMKRCQYDVSTHEFVNTATGKVILLIDSRPVPSIEPPLQGAGETLVRRHSLYNFGISSSKYGPFHFLLP